MVPRWGKNLEKSIINKTTKAGEEKLSMANHDVGFKPK